MQPTALRPAALVLALTAPVLADGPFQDLSFDEALTAAKQAKNVVFIDFFTTWCAPCKELDRVTWKDERVVVWLTEKTIALKIDAEDEIDLAKRFGVDGYPTLLFVDPAGTERGRIVGFREPEEFLSEAADVLHGVTECERLQRELETAPNDPSLRRRYGTALAREGHFEEALREYLWCYDKGMAHAPDFRSVRTSFLLADIVRLGKNYPAAFAALREREAAARERVLAGEGGATEAIEVASICRDLREKERVLELWDGLAAEDRLDAPMRQALFDHVVDLLLAAGRHADVLAGVGDVFAYLDGKLQFFEMATADLSDQSLRDFMLRTTLVDTAKVYGALLGAKDERGPLFAERVLAFDASALAFSRLVRAAAGVEAWATARELLVRAYASVDEEDHGALRAAERKLPKAERLPRDEGTPETGARQAGQGVR